MYKILFKVVYYGRSFFGFTFSQFGQKSPFPIKVEGLPGTPIFRLILDFQISVSQTELPGIYPLLKSVKGTDRENTSLLL